MEKAPSYSIVVVTWQCARHLRALVDSMNRHLDSSQELVVVDNASDDEPEASARQWSGRMSFTRLEHNAGFGAAANAGVASAAGEATVVLNPDTELIDDSLDALARRALELGAIIGPRVLNADGSVQPSASGPEVGVWPWVRALAPGVLTPAPLRRYTEPYRLERPVPVTWLTGACIAAPTLTLRRLGPFDPALRMYAEDLDLGVRAAGAGIASWFDPTVCRLVHHGQESSLLAYGSREAWRGEGMLNRRASLRRAHGPRREWLAWRALRLNLRLRLLAKSLLRRATDRDRIALQAAIAANKTRELPQPRTGP
jgi:N-acetylglucosaminyl-diphospho-decaprenol L-rhamnosyltransferase